MKAQPYQGFGPFEPFTYDKLEELLKIHPVTKQGRDYIDSALQKPARNVAGTPFNQVADIPCPKMYISSPAEAATTEFPFTLDHIFNGVVIGYCNQPPTLGLSYKGRNLKNVRTPYTPDSLVFHWHEGILMEEWKPTTDRERLAEKYPGKFTRNSDGTYSSTPISDIIEPWGFKFRLRFGDEISQIGHANRKFLFTYLQSESIDRYSSALPEILRVFDQKLCLSYFDLIEAGIDADSLNWALATSRLHFDFDTALIERYPAEVLVFRHIESLNAWRLSLRPDGSKPKLPSPFLPNRDITPGDIVIFDGLRLTVNVVGATAIHAIDECQNHLTIRHDQLVAALRAQTLVLPERLQSQNIESPFWQASNAALARAVEKADAIDRLQRNELIESDDRCSDSTYRRWRKNIRDGLTRGWSPIESLLDDFTGRGFHGPHIALDFSETLNAWIAEKLSDKKCPSKLSIYTAVEKLAEANGQKMIALSSFYERVKQLKSLKQVRDSKGHKHEYALKPSYWQLVVSTPIHGVRAFESVHFDSTLLDIEILSSLSGEVLGRPWLSLALCANTRMVLGMYLSFQPPSHISSLMLLADIVRRFGRLPESIVHDWGSEFKAKTWTFALTALHIIRHVRPKSSPRFGAVLERMFGVLTTELLNNVAGNTKLRKEVRKLTPAADPTNHSGLWLFDLHLGLENYFFQNYNNRKHPATFMPPAAALEASFLKHGLRAHQLRALHDILPILMPAASGQPRIVDPARGIFVNYRYYGHPELTKLALAGSSVEVKPLLFDPGSVLAFLKGRWVVCKSNISERFARCPESVRQCIYEELRIEQRLVVKSDHLSRQKLRDLHESLNKKALENIAYWNDEDASDVLNTVDLAEDTATSPTSSNLSKLEEAMRSALSVVMAQQEAT